jgi:hypothetical protein
MSAIVAEPAPQPLEGDPAAILEAALDGLEAPVVEEPAPEAPTNDAEPGAEGEPAEAAEAAPEAPANDTDEDYVVSTERPWTAERAARAHEKQRQQQRDIDTLFIKARKKDDKAGRRLNEAREEMQRAELVRKQLAVDISALQHAEGREVLNVLARVTGREASSLYEEMSLAIVGAKKSDPRDAVIGRLEEQIQKLVAKVESQDTDREQKQIFTEIRSHIRDVVGRADEWPTLGAKAAPNQEQAAVEFEKLYVDHCRQLGQWIDVEQFADKLERHLRKNGGNPARPEVEREVHATANPGSTAQGAPGKSLTPSLARENGGSRRELSEQERIAELASDPDFFRNLGIPM